MLEATKANSNGLQPKSDGLQPTRHGHQLLLALEGACGPRIAGAAVAKGLATLALAHSISIRRRSKGIKESSIEEHDMMCFFLLEPHSSYLPFSHKQTRLVSSSLPIALRNGMHGLSILSNKFQVCIRFARQVGTSPLEHAADGSKARSLVKKKRRSLGGASGERPTPLGLTVPHCAQLATSIAPISCGVC